MPKLTLPKETWAFFNWEPKSVMVKLVNLPVDWESAKRLVKCSILEFLPLKANSFIVSRYS
jgi:hypothetical protein